MYCVEVYNISNYKLPSEDNTGLMMSDSVCIRPARKEDCIEIARLIQELADFERMPNGPQINYSVLEKDGFESDPPLFNCLVAEAPNTSNNNHGSLWGYALYYNTYSTWTGKTLFLEDLYVTVEARSKKVGSLLFRNVCKCAINTNCSRMDFHVLAWNPAREFYEKHGAKELTDSEGWHVYRMTKQALEAIEV